MNTPIYADLNQIVFEGRSKDYGAYQMRERYNRVLTRASLIAFLLFISITALPKMVSWLTPKAVLEEPCPEETLIVTEVTLPEDKPIEKPAEPMIPLPTEPPMKTVAVNVPIPTPEEDIIEERKVAEIADLDSAAVGLVDHDGDNGGDYPWSDIPTGNCKECPPSEVVLPTEPNDEPPMNGWVLLEKEPQPVNLDELKHLIGYPPMAVEAEIEGRVTLRVLVDKYGNYVKHAVVKDPHPILTRAVTEKINLLKMTPGIQAGKPIKVWVTLPFNFELQH